MIDLCFRHFRSPHAPSIIHWAKAEVEEKDNAHEAVKQTLSTVQRTLSSIEAEAAEAAATAAATAGGGDDDDVEKQAAAPAGAHIYAERRQKALAAAAASMSRQPRPLSPRHQRPLSETTSPFGRSSTASSPVRKLSPGRRAAIAQDAAAKAHQAAQRLETAQDRLKAAQERLKAEVPTIAARLSAAAAAGAAFARASCRHTATEDAGKAAAGRSATRVASPGRSELAAERWPEAAGQRCPGAQRGQRGWTAAGGWAVPAG